MTVLLVVVIVLLAAVLAAALVLASQLRGNDHGGPGIQSGSGKRAASAAPLVDRPTSQDAGSDGRAADEMAAAQVLRRAQDQAAALLAQTEQQAAAARERAERAAATAAEDARRQARESAEADLATLRAELDSRVARLSEREERLIQREGRLDSEQHHLSEREREILDQTGELTRRRAELAEVEQERVRILEQTAALTAQAAKAELVKTIETQAKREAAVLVRDLEAEARDEGEQRARSIVVDAIQRVASEQTSESVVSVLHLPGDEMKGRIIGREGRNIRTFETVTGVNLVIDDTPEAVLLSCFDPVRREVGRVTLEALVADGRIHPHRIEEVYERSKAEVDAGCLRAGQDALVAVGIAEMHPDLVDVLGRLKYRTSYGQNVLKHLIETAHLAGLMAAELGMDPTVVKRGAFLHDIGKALTHEVEGSHALVGADLARRHGESEEVVHAIEAHHNEVAPQTIEAVLTQASDSCSGGRPGARRESLEAYVTRLHRIEEIASTQAGVDKVFAMQAGREVRVMVQPDAVDDLGAQVIARDVAKQIEQELTYPGQIRVTVVRETRTSEIAH